VSTPKPDVEPFAGVSRKKKPDHSRKPLSKRTLQPRVPSGGVSQMNVRRVSQNMASVAVISVTMIFHSFGNELPPNLEHMLHDNIDHIDFRTFTVARSTEDKYNVWICGTISVKTIHDNYLEERFVAQLYGASAKQMGFPSSWITTVDSDTSEQVYREHCEK
jgi:hypothetical protein